jgi:formate hydrogenlyase subunit 4
MAQTIGLAIVNLVILVGLAPLADGLLRKLRATLHSRKGPPITQPYTDLLKLLGKEDLTPQGAVGFGGLVWKTAPALCLGAVMVAALFVPLVEAPPLNLAGDLIVFLYLLGLAAVAIALAGFACGNPYAYVGSSREIMMVMTAEPVMAIALVAIAVKAHSLTFGGLVAHQALGPSVSGVIAALAFLLALQANVGKLPFDIAEAETEIMDGPFIERSGPGLALFRLAAQAKTLIFTFVMVAVFVPWPRIEGMLLLNSLLNLAKVGVVLILVEVANVANPRLRIDQSMVYFSRVVVFVAVVALVFAVMGA